MFRFGLSVLLVVCVSGCKPHPPAATTAPTPADEPGCLASGDGFLRARLQGARDAQVDWSNAEIVCEGGLRPDASGIRVSIAGPLAGAERLRFVFGISDVKQNEAARARPTNLTAILERDHRIFATLGDDKCTVDELHQKPLAGLPANSFRVEARGFCIAPATLVGGDERLLVSTFDFAGRITLEPEPAGATPAKPTL